MYFDTFEKGPHSWVEYYRRITEEDLCDALGSISEREQAVAYVCGPPVMTDWAVERLRDAEGMSSERVLCEKWW